MGAEPEPSIEIIEPDEAAFHDLPAAAPASHEGRRTPWRVIATTGAVAALLASAGVVVATLRPWAASHAAPTDRLVIAGIGPPTHANAKQEQRYGTTTTDPADEMVMTEIFATPGATLDSTTLDGANGAWLTVESYRSDQPPVPLRGKPLLTVQGAPGTFVGGPDDAAIVFGPVDGFYFNVYGVGLGRLGVRAVAETVGREGSAFTFADTTALGDMQSIGDAEAYQVVATVATAAGLGRWSGSGRPYTRVCYGADQDERCVVAAVAADIRPEMLHLVAGDMNPVDVRGRTGWTRTWTWTDYSLDPEDPQGQIVTERHTTVVLWQDDGVLIALTGDIPADELAHVAESVRPASAAEWEEIEALFGGFR